jgi:3-dehydroquinate synthase
VAICVKQAVNTTHGKNLLGTIYTPSVSLIDTAVLQSLPKRELQSGLAESIKHALYQSIEFFDYLRHHSVAHLYDPQFLHNVVTKTARLKAQLFNSGEGSDTNMDLVGQYGHVIAHALESASGYNLRHGEAVAIGMCVTAELALLLGRSDMRTLQHHYLLSTRFGLPVRVPSDLAWERIADRLCRDKHYESGLPHITLLRTVGVTWASAKDEICGPVQYEDIRKAVELNRSRTGAEFEYKVSSDEKDVSLTDRFCCAMSLVLARDPSASLPRSAQCIPVVVRLLAGRAP